MTNEIQGAPVITPAQAHAVVAELTPLSKYLADELYRRYVSQCTQDGRQPVHPVVLGRMFKHIGCERRKKGTGAKASAAWLVTASSQRPEWADGRWV